MTRTRVRAALAVVALAALAGCASTPIDHLAAADAAAASADAGDRAGFRAADVKAARAGVQELLSRPITADAAVAIALVRNRDVEAGYAMLGVARAEYVQAGLFSNPVLLASATAFDEGTEIEGALTANILDAFFVPLRRRAAEFELDAARLRVARDLVRIAFEARRAHAQVATAAALERHHASSVAAAEASQRLMRGLHEAGNMTGLDIAREDAAVARARLDLHAAESALREAREDLNAALGLWGPETQWTLARVAEREAAGPESFDGVESRAIAASLDLAAERAEIESAAQRAGLVEWSALLPLLEGGVVAKREPVGDWGFGPEVVLELPVFDRGDARIAAADADLRARLAKFEAHAVDIRRAARRFRDRVLTLREREAYLREAYVAAREQIVHETLLVYNAMQIGAFDVLAARRQEIDARREHEETRGALRLAHLDLAELLAGRLDHERANNMHLPAGSDAASSPGGGAGEH